MKIGAHETGLSWADLAAIQEGCARACHQQSGSPVEGGWEGGCEWVAIQVQVQQWHPSVHHWDHTFNTRYYAYSPSRTTVVISHLTSRKIYRARVTVHNASGFSRASAWHQKKVK